MSLYRFSLCALICVALLTYGLTQESHAQRKGGPPTPPDAGGDPNAPPRVSSGGRRPPGGPGSPDAGAAPGVGGGVGDGVGRRTATTARPKFINLLESKDLSQFRGYAQEEIGEGWSLDGKELYFDGSGGGDVITKEVYSDFDLQVEWKVADGANSGIMYRVSLGDEAPYISGPEYQILDDAEHGDGKNELTAAGSLYGMFPAKEKTLRKVGSWNKTRITVQGNSVTHYLNGKKVLEVEIGSDEWNKQLGESKFKDWEKFGKNKEGHIAFQDHGNEVWFRNIRIKNLAKSEMAENGADAPKRTQRRGGKFAGMESSISGGDKDAAPTPPKKPTQRRGGKFEKMESSVSGGDKGGKGGDPDK